MDALNYEITWSRKGKRKEVFINIEYNVHTVSSELDLCSHSYMLWTFGPNDIQIL